MKKLMLSISAISLSATMALAQSTGVEPTDPNNPGPVFEAWMSSADTHEPLPPFPHRDPTPPQTFEPRKPDPLTIPMRMYKSCDGPGACAYVDQVGEDNAIDIQQGGAPGGSVADVIQIGNNNAASVEQRFGAAAHYGVVTQNGDDNGAAIRQFSDIVTGASYADIHQGGDGTNGGGLTKANNNWASIDQGIGAGGGSVASYGNKAKIHQEGMSTGVANNNVAAIVQRGDVMRSLIEQDGEDNKASILQTGTGGGANSGAAEDNEARITQVGLDNTAASHQDGQRQRSSITQIGNFNTASTEQFGIEGGVGNTALIHQDGDANESVILQEGDNNMASSVQLGNDNFSSIWQSGLGNMAATVQTGDGNSSAIAQMGDLNVASVSQNGGDLADVEQTGTGNVAAVWQ